MRETEILIPESDWNFDGVPVDELVACCYWEYARESTFLRDLRRRCWDLQQKGDPNEPSVHADLQKVQSIGYPAHFFLRGFFSPPQGVPPGKASSLPPEVNEVAGSFPQPWQTLTREERAYRTSNTIPPRGSSNWAPIPPFERGRFQDCKQILKNVASERHEGEEANARAQRQDSEGTQNALVRPGEVRLAGVRPSVLCEQGWEKTVVLITWGLFTNEQIVQSFRRWVKENRPKDMPSPDGKGRNKVRDWRAKLTRLAVMRVLARFTALDIVDTQRDKFPAIWKSKQFSGPKWHDVTKWYDARREAEKLFHEFFPFLPSNEKPRSRGRPIPGK
jgi:hypothetical protein